MSQVETLSVSESFVPDVDIIKKTKELYSLYFKSDHTSYVSPIIDESVAAAVPVQDEDVVFAEQSTMSPTLTPPIEDVTEDASMASWMIEYISGFGIVQT